MQEKIIKHFISAVLDLLAEPEQMGSAWSLHRPNLASEPNPSPGAGMAQAQSSPVGQGWRRGEGTSWPCPIMRRRCSLAPAQPLRWKGSVTQPQSSHSREGLCPVLTHLPGLLAAGWGGSTPTAPLPPNFLTCGVLQSGHQGSMGCIWLAGQRLSTQ